MKRTQWSADELRALLSSISHDLRTPLSVITGRASVLRFSMSDSHQRDLETIIQEAQRLSRTLENLLAVTADDLMRPREWVPIEELVGAVLARLEPVLAGREMVIEVPDNTLVHLDPVQGELLLANLLDNAVGRTAPGTALELRARRSNGALIVEVADRGDERPSKPRGVDRTRADELGLTACKRIAESYGGTLEVAPRDGGGTLFHVVLPDGEPLPDLVGETNAEGV